MVVVSIVCDKLEDSQSHLVQSSVHWHLPADSNGSHQNETLFQMQINLYKYDLLEVKGGPPLRALTSSWRPFEPSNFVLRAIRALRPCDPRNSDWIVC